MADKIVEFWVWCKRCKHNAVPETEDPCNECLADSVNEDSHKPTRWEEKSNENRRQKK